MEQNGIEQQLREHITMTCQLLLIEQEMQKRIEQAYWRDLAEQYEHFTIMLLERLKARGVVKWHVWQSVCPNSVVVDNTLGVDHFGELTEEFSNIFFMINTKATPEALRKHWKKEGRGNVLGYHPGSNIAHLSESQLQEREENLLTEIQAFFGGGDAQDMHEQGG